MADKKKHTKIEMVVGSDLSNYYPERDYIKNGYQPFHVPFEDLCASCDVYYAFLKNKGITSSDFPARCKRHIKEQYQELSVSDFGTDTEFQDFLVMSDPVAWAYANFGWKARWYQEEVMSCTSHKKIIRAGRRVGKTSTIAILILWYLSTNENYNILVVAPYEIQVIKIFDEINRLLDKCPDLRRSVNRNTRAPCRLGMNNGSMAIGFSSGPHSAAGATKIRGQDADYIFIDEADYINQVDTEAILAILASHPDTCLWGSSTPTGRHEKFYQWSRQKELGFKEFWYISSESPNWTADTEKFFRTNVDSTTYDHEFNAEFGIQESGVFRNDLVDRALMRYSLPFEKTGGSRIIIGVDWNGQSIGTHIVVCQAILHHGAVKYVMLDKTIIRGGDFTQHDAITAICSLDEEYGADFIYVDAGYGEVQIEMLRKIGIDHPETNMHKKVVSYAMQTSLEITDPVSGIKIKKNAKPFMVNWATMQLEQNRIILPTSEDTQVMVESSEGEDLKQTVGLVQQMRNFSVDRISALGLPTYSQGDDHTLTAWMLCIVGFGLEYSDLQTKVVTHAIPRIVGQPGEGTEIDPEKQEHNQRLADSVRQLDGEKRYGGASTISAASQDRKDNKIQIAKGSKRAIRRHFRDSPVNRNTSLDFRTRGMPKGPGRSSF